MSLHPPYSLVMLLTGSIIGLYVLYAAQQAVLLIVFAGILAVGLAGGVQALSQRTGLGKYGSFSLVIGVLALFLVLIGWYGAPALTTQFTQFISIIDRTPPALEALPFGGEVPSLLHLLEQNIGDVLSGLQSLFVAASTFLTLLIVSLFIMLYGSWHAHWYQDLTERILPKTRFPLFHHRLAVSVHALRFWLFGRILSMIVVGILVYLGLLVLGTPLALLLATTAALLSFIPNIGPLVSVIPALLVVSTDGWFAMLMVLMVYTVAQFIESYFITPLIQQKLVSIPPAALIATQVVFGAAFGVLGLLLAAPLGAIMMAFINDTYGESETGAKTEHSH